MNIAVFSVNFVKREVVRIMKNYHELKPSKCHLKGNKYGSCNNS